MFGISRPGDRVTGLLVDVVSLDSAYLLVGDVFTALFNTPRNNFSLILARCSGVVLLGSGSHVSAQSSEQDLKTRLFPGIQPIGDSFLISQLPTTRVRCRITI
jgi:hypothetical protein